MQLKKKTKATSTESNRRDAPSAWLNIKAKYKGCCAFCGCSFDVGATIRYQPSTRRVRCIATCAERAATKRRFALDRTVPKQRQASDRTGTEQKPSAPKPIWAYPTLEGEYISFFGQGEYFFRKCVACSRDFEQAAGRVALAKKRGVCPVCEERRDGTEMDRLKEAALRADGSRFGLQVMEPAAT